MMNLISDCHFVEFVYYGLFADYQSFHPLDLLMSRLSSYLLHCFHAAVFCAFAFFDFCSHGCEPYQKALLQLLASQMQQQGEVVLIVWTVRTG